MISDVNGNLVEYVLDVVVDTSKTSNSNNRPSNDSPVYLKLTPKAQWPLQRFISSEEVKCPLQSDNPLLVNGFSAPTPVSSLQQQQQQRKASVNEQPQFNSHSPHSFNSLSYMTAPSSMQSNHGGYMDSLQYQHQANGCNGGSEWMKQIEINSHIGPHRRLFMGPQFVFKTFNSSITTTMLNAGSAAVIGDGDNTPIIDLSDDIELNTLE